MMVWLPGEMVVQTKTTNTKVYFDSDTVFFHSKNCTHIKRGSAETNNHMLRNSGVNDVKIYHKNMGFGENYRILKLYRVVRA